MLRNSLLGPTPALFFYCVSSILMTITNKLVLSHYQFKLNFLLLAIQSLCCVVLLYLFSSLNYVSYQPLHASIAKKWFHVSLALVAMIYTGSKALQYLSIPLVTIFKNLTIIIIAYSERYIYHGEPVTGLTFLSFCLMVFSSVIASYSDLQSGNLVKDSASNVGVWVAYSWMLMNCFTSAFYALTMRSTIQKVNFKDFDTVYYNNMLSIPVLLICSVFVEWEDYFDFFSTMNMEGPDYQRGLFMSIFVSSICTFAISYATSWSMRVTSSTTYSMVGALNKLPIAVFGMLFFGDTVTPLKVTAILIAFSAGLLYSFVKSRKKKTSLPMYTSLEKKDKLIQDE